MKTIEINDTTTSLLYVQFVADFVAHYQRDPSSYEVWQAAIKKTNICNNCLSPAIVNLCSECFSETFMVAVPAKCKKCRYYAQSCKGCGVDPETKD